jgi:DNA-3-methyladenine glycosylase II
LDGTPVSSAGVKLDGPFDLPRSIRAGASFFPARNPLPTKLRLAMRVGARSTIIEIRQRNVNPPILTVRSSLDLDRERLREILRRLVSAQLDLRPFYRLAAGHPVMGPVSRSLWGVKPLPPPSLFEMTVIAITEQQLSLAAAFHIRARIVARFGKRLKGLWLFPSPSAIAKSSLAELRRCGLSHQKARYVRDLAERVAARRLDLEGLREKSDAAARAVLEETRGLGAWSIDYILARGLGRPDSLPAEDIGLRRVVGSYLARGRVLSPQGLERVLAPFAPFRSLAAYYLAVHAHICSSANLQAIASPGSRHEPLQSGNPPRIARRQ